MQVTAVGNQERFLALEGGRGVLALVVMLAHFDVNFHGKWFFSAINLYYLVDYFFVFSGFLMAWIYWERMRTARDLGNYFVVRFCRIYPLHLFWVAIFVLFELFRLTLNQEILDSRPFTGAYAIEKLPEHVFMLQAMGLSKVHSWNFPSWSLSTEFFAYIVFGGYIFITSKWRVWAAVAIVLLCAIALWVWSDIGFQETVYMGFYRCLASFMMGVILFRFYRKTLFLKNSPGLMTILGLLALCLLFSFSFISTNKAWSFLTPLVAGFMVWTLVYDAGLLSRFFSSRIPLFLGAMSFSMYLAHVFIENRLFNLLKLLEQKGWGSYFTPDIHHFSEWRDVVVGLNQWQGDLIALLTIFITIAVSYATFHLVEEPTRKLGKRLIAARKPASAS